MDESGYLRAVLTTLEKPGRIKHATGVSELELRPPTIRRMPRQTTVGGIAPTTRHATLDERREIKRRKPITGTRRRQTREKRAAVSPSTMRRHPPAKRKGDASGIHDRGVAEPPTSHRTGEIRHAIRVPERGTSTTTRVSGELPVHGNRASTRLDDPTAESI